jgi:hypothetical protein
MSVHQLITAQLKLITTADQFQARRVTQLACRDALNAVSSSACEQGKTSKVTRLHTGMDAELRTHHHLPSPLACRVERQVAAPSKGLWTKVKQKAEHRRKNITKKRCKGLDQPPRSSSPTMQYPSERDYTFQRDRQGSRGTLNGRVSVAYQGYDKHGARIGQAATIGDAKLWYDRPKKRLYLLVSLTIDIAALTPTHLTHVVGVDVGLRASCRDLHGNRQGQFSPWEASPTSRQPLRTKRNKRRWMQITPALACPVCGHTSEENRPSRGLLFACQNPLCGYTLHADLIGARHVTLRTLLVRHDWIRTGCLSIIPDASGGFAKAARLSRYAELRWSPDVTQASGF